MNKIFSLAILLFLLAGCSISDKVNVENLEDKEEVVNTASWEYKTEVTDTDEYGRESGDYILVKDGEEVDRFSMGAFSNISINENSNGSALISHWDGGPEGGFRTNYLYDQNANIIMKTLETRPFDTDAFIIVNNNEYRVTSALKNSCEGSTMGDPNYDKSTTLIGLKIEIGNFNIPNFTANSEQDFLTGVEHKTECLERDWNVVNPEVNVKELLDNKVILEFDGGEAELIFGEEEYPTVTFI